MLAVDTWQPGAFIEAHLQITYKLHHVLGLRMSKCDMSHLFFFLFLCFLQFVLICGWWTELRRRNTHTSPLWTGMPTSIHPSVHHLVNYLGIGGSSASVLPLPRPRLFLRKEQAQVLIPRLIPQCDGRLSKLSVEYQVGG